MRRAGLFFAVFLLLSLALPAAPAGAAPSGPPQPSIVVLRDDVADPGAIARQHASANGFNVAFVYQYALRGYAASIPQAAIANISRDPRVLFVSEDRAVAAVGQTRPTGVDRIDADASSHFASNTWPAGFAVAVIDTGSGPHPDINIAGGYNCSTGRSYNDGNGHGTHTAGTIGAINNADGVVGVAPGVPIYSVRVLNNQGSGSWSAVACGIDWVTGHAASLGIKVASMSLGGSGSDDGSCGSSNSDALHKAICSSVNAGVTYVVAAGNSNEDMKGFVPAAYDEVLTVTAASDSDGHGGATGGAPTCRTGEQDDYAASFSNWTTAGSADAGHTIAAPGVCILSTWKGGGYNTISGTSMATPHVSGVAALCIASGRCSGGPAATASTLRSDAAARSNDPTVTPYYGFTGDPNHPIGSRYYGYLSYAAVN